eukprot:974092-Rhodomonas_salina.2
MEPFKLAGRNADDPAARSRPAQEDSGDTEPFSAGAGNEHGCPGGPPHGCVGVREHGGYLAGHET